MSDKANDASVAVASMRHGMLSSVITGRLGLFVKCTLIRNTF